MKQLLGLLALSTAVAAPASAQQVVLDFEDLTGFAPMPAGYGGVANWGSWAHSDLVDPNYPAASGVVKVLSVGLQQRIQFGQDVIFEGANVVSALPFSWDMYYQGQLVASSTVLSPNTGGPAVWLASGYTGLVDELEYNSTVNVHGVDDFTYTIPGSSIGSNFCMANPNSTGAAGVISAFGSDIVANNDVTLAASGLPPQVFGIFIVSATEAPNPITLGAGNLCLTGTIGRYSLPGQIFTADASGDATLAIDLTTIPQASQTVAVQPGETWNFQAWHRDVAGGTFVANLTDGIALSFL